MRSPAAQTVLAQAKPHEVQGIFNELWKERHESVARNAWRKGLEARFKGSKYLRDLLEATGEAPILYVSTKDNFIGTGPQTQGQNMYGKALMDLRTALRADALHKSVKEASLEREQLIYDTYLARKALTDLMTKGQVLEEGVSSAGDLKEFIGMTPSLIVEKLGREKLQLRSPRKEMVLQLAENNRIPDILRIVIRPENLTQEVRKGNIVAFQKAQQAKREDMVFTMYADYLLEKFYKDVNAEDYAKAQKQQFKEMSPVDLRNLKTRLFALYESGRLSERLSTKIDENLHAITVWDEKEVQDLMHLDLDYSKGPVVIEQPPQGPEAKILVYPRLTKEVPVEYRAYTAFSPLAQDVDPTPWATPGPRNSRTPGSVRANTPDQY